MVVPSHCLQPCCLLAAIDAINDLIDDHKPEQAIALRPQALRVTRDLLTQLEMQRSLLVHKLDNPRLTDVERRKLEVQNQAVIEREQEADELMDELRTLDPFQTHSDGSSSPRLPLDDHVAVSISIEDMDGKAMTASHSRRSLRTQSRRRGLEPRGNNGDSQGLPRPRRMDHDGLSSHSGGRSYSNDSHSGGRPPPLKRVPAVCSVSSLDVFLNASSTQQTQHALTTATGLQPRHLEPASLSMVVAQRTQSNSPNVFKPKQQYPNMAIV